MGEVGSTHLVALPLSEILKDIVALEEERKTLKSTLDVDLNLSQHLMSTSQVNISCQHLMSIFQLDFPFLMPSISQYLEFIIYNCYFWVGFPVSAVKYFSKFGILHLRLQFWGGFPVSTVKYFSKNFLHHRFYVQSNWRYSKNIRNWSNYSN